MSISRMMSDVDDAAEERGGEAERRCRSTSASVTTAEADQQRQPRAVDEAREHVAADVVGAERERSDRRRCCHIGGVRK